jgi:hypothetical protein
VRSTTWELRVDQVFRGRQALEARSNELRDMLLEKGWKPLQ